MRQLRVREGELDELCGKLGRAINLLSAEGEWARVGELENEAEVCLAPFLWAT